MKIYKDLFLLNGISGYEKEVKLYMETYMKKYSNYEIIKDKLGGIFAYKKSANANYTIMIAAHMDEVGFIVTRITDNGLIMLNNIGSISMDIMPGLVLNVITNNGIIPGVVTTIPPHLKNYKTSSEQTYLDIGCSTKNEVILHGVELGNMVVFNSIYHETNTKVITKAVDNRYGCALALELIKYFNDISLPYNLVIGATVMEEVGLRGAEVAGNLFKPDFFCALDASPVNDALDDASMAKLGNGFLLRMYDPKNIMPSYLMEYFIDLASKKKIKYQHFISAGGTDAAKVLELNDGVITTTIGLPARYIHSAAAIFDKKDLLACKNFAIALLESLNDKTIKIIKNIQ